MSHTTNPGNLDTELSNDEDQLAADPRPRTVPLRVIVLGVIALLLAVYIGTQVLGVLYVIMFPPGPPLPADLTLMSHTNTDYGVDGWSYSSTQQPCDIVTFYENSGGECELLSASCSDGQTVTSSSNVNLFPGQNAATCTGVTHPSIFAMRWSAVISIAGVSDGATEFDIRREMFWTGQAPPVATPEAP